MNDPSDSATLPQTAPAVNPISIIRDTPDSGRLMRGTVECGDWYRVAGGPVTARIDGKTLWSVRVDTVRGLLRRYGYEVAS